MPGSGGRIVGCHSMHCGPFMNKYLQDGDGNDQHGTGHDEVWLCLNLVERLKCLDL